MLLFATPMMLTIKYLPDPWLNNVIREYMSIKNRAKIVFAADFSNANRKKYHVVRNNFNALIRDTQCRHLSNENEDSAKAWRFLKFLGVSKAHESKILMI